MCTIVILRRPGHDWPLIFAANRDEMAGRAWLAPGRHWSERAEVVAGQDLLAGGTWLGLNDWGVIAGVLNRPGSLGPDAHLRSRGELPLEALEHAEAAVAAESMTAIAPASYRRFNLVIADAKQAFWIKSAGGGGGDAESDNTIGAEPIPDGISMITAHDLNDTASPRIRHFLPKFEAAAEPDPGTGDWAAWQALMGGTGREAVEDSMSFATEAGFGTVSSSLIALPDSIRAFEDDALKPKWLFAPGRPDKTAYAAVEL